MYTRIQAQNPVELKRNHLFINTPKMVTFKKKIFKAYN